MFSARIWSILGLLALLVGPVKTLDASTKTPYTNRARSQVYIQNPDCPVDPYEQDDIRDPDGRLIALIYSQTIRPGDSSLRTYGPSDIDVGEVDDLEPGKVYELSVRNVQGDTDPFLQLTELTPDGKIIVHSKDDLDPVGCGHNPPEPGSCDAIMELTSNPRSIYSFLTLNFGQFPSSDCAAYRVSLEELHRAYLPLVSR